jgi:transposase
MFKILILEYLYCLSDVKVVERTKTDVVFRWFLGLKLDDSVPDMIQQLVILELIMLEKKNSKNSSMKL